MSTGADTVCYTAITSCASYDVTCFESAACSVSNYAICSNAIESANTCARRKQKLRADSTSTTTSDMSSYPFTSSVYLYGLASLSSTYPVYCDHTHLYSFYFDNVTPVVSTTSTVTYSGDSASDLVVWASTMIGGFPDICSYYDYSGISYPIVEGEILKTTGDQMAGTCGYYTQY